MKRLLFLILLTIIYQGINAQNTYKSKSILASGKWIKVSKSGEGICMITYDQLTNWGISSPENVSIYSNQGYMLPKMNYKYYPDDLEKIPVLHNKNKDGQNAIFFYCSGPVEWEYDSLTSKYLHTLNIYTDSTFFYLSSDITKSYSPENKTINSTNSEVTFNSYDQHLLYELELQNLQNSGRRWYGDEILGGYSKTFSFNSPNVISSENAVITIAAASGVTSSTNYGIDINNQFIDNLNFQKASGENKRRRVLDASFKPASSTNIKLTFNTNGANGSSWLDYITITQKAQLKKENQILAFRNNLARNYKSVKYTIQGNFVTPILWDITNPINPKSIKVTNNSGNISFIDDGGKINNYILFDIGKDNFSTPDYVEEVANQNIHGLPLYDFIIVTHPNFISASETLADYHRDKDNMKVLVITTNEIYNEFSSGMPDVSAIRNMARMFYSRKTESDSLRYILLMGDGSFNNRGIGVNVPNFIPTYQSEESETEDSFVSDDFFVLLDKDEGESYGTLDIGIGRIPCRTLDEADLVVSKVMHYTESKTMGDWRNVITFIADDEDSNQYMSQSESLISLVKDKYTGFYVDKIYLDAYTQIETAGGPHYPDVTEAIKQRVEDGALILNYVGHANERGLAKETILGVSDINSWSNQNKLPVFVTATCEFSRFDNTETSAGEQILLNPAGGGVALFSTSRLVYAIDNKNLNLNFYNSVFQQDKNGDNFRLGDIMKMAKNLTKDINANNKRNFILLGDPALQLAFPKYKIVTNTINGMDVSDSITIGALDKVTVEGEIIDHWGNLLTEFSGNVSATVYDKAVNVKTLNNDGEGAFDYTVQNNIIYKGKSTVSSGKFQFSFIVPKDITYNVGKGRIIYYAEDGVEDGNGSTEMFNIGGSSQSPKVDNDPPEVEMFMNDEHFKPNDKISSSALLLANLYDESGINTVGTGIGHDIVAILDNDYSKPMVLNDFYKSELNSYQRGKIIYPISNLDPGEHVISIKVWDVQNNSTYKELNFIVGEGFEITTVSNYPNPVSFSTTFDITHNLPGNVFETKLEIFNLNGYKIWETEETTGSYGSVNTSIRWDITDTNFPIDKEKILVYRVTMINQQGLRATGAGKLLLKLN